MGPKRASEGDPQANKIPKIEEALSDNQFNQQRIPNTDFSGSVKKKLEKSTRTGQACDRCKIRKIRCDGRPEGCSPCQQNRTSCKTTDRITGRATTRGHTEATEAENNFLRAQIADLQAQLRELGVEPRTLTQQNDYTSNTMQDWSASNLGATSQSWNGQNAQDKTNTSPLPGYVPAAANPHAIPENAGIRALPQFKTDSIGDNYLGISSADSLLSHIKGTSLSVFGSEIDMTDFVQNEEEYDKSVMSYNHYLDIAFSSGDQVEFVPFPEYKQLNEYGSWYFRSLNPYTMLLDKRTTMDLIWRIWHEPNFTPSAAENVQVHMMLAILKYQISARNSDEDLMGEAHKHYQYSLSFFRALLQSHTLADIQGMTLISLHMRNFPKPGAAWIMTSFTFLLAIELGLHRSAKAWVETGPKKDPLEIEVRKRVFWTLHALASNLNGKLGRPMPISLDEIDVEFPEAVDDSLPTDDPNLSSFHKCSFQVGIQIAKYTVISSKLYSTIYSLKQSAHNYEDTVRMLENDVSKWREQLPYELSEGGRSNQNYIFGLFLEFWDCELQLLLHHPAVCRSTDPEFINANLDKCLAASSKMLRNCDALRRFRSLDIPWINSVVYIAAIFTTLFVHFQRRDSMTSADMSKLKADMSLWIDIVGVCGQLLGSADTLKDAIRKIVEHSLSSINEHIVKKTATEAVARAALGQATQDSSASSGVYANGGSYHQQYADPAAGQTDPALGVSTDHYGGVQQAATYGYSNGTPGAGSAYQSTPTTYDQTPYSGEEPAISAAQLTALTNAASGANPRENFVYGNTGGPAQGHQVGFTPNGTTSNEWQQWSRTFMNQPAGQQSGEYRPQEYLNTATTLMSLGGREGNSQVGSQDGPLPVGASTTQWPVNIFDIGPNGHAGQR